MFEMMPFRKGNKGLNKGDYFNQLFNDFFDDGFLTPMNFWQDSFRVDMKETDDAYSIEADLPGMKKDDIEIIYDNNYLTICAKRNESVENKTDSYVRRERHYGEFKRSFYIDNVDESKVDASFNDGVLKLVLPKIVKGKQKKRIDIR